MPGRGLGGRGGRHSGTRACACQREPSIFNPPPRRYWEGKGFAVMLTARLLNLAALAFTGGCHACAGPACPLCTAAAPLQGRRRGRLPGCRPVLVAMLLLPPHPSSTTHTPTRSPHVGGAAAVRQLGGAAGRLPAARHLRHLGGEFGLGVQ